MESDFDLYEVYWRGEGQEFTRIGTSKETSYIIDQGIDNGDNYYFKVRAANQCGGFGPFSDQLSAKLGGGPPGQIEVVET